MTKHNPLDWFNSWKHVGLLWLLVGVLFVARLYAAARTRIRSHA